MLDNSVSAAWCFEDQSTPYTEGVLQAVIAGAKAVVPAIWRLEIVNALVVAERRKKIASETSSRFLKDVERLGILVDTEGLDRAFGTLVDIARFHQRSAYDACYLELAQRLALPLSTKDEPLRKAAEGMGISVYQP